MEYSLVGVDGNAYAIIGYVRMAMEHCGFSKQEVDAYLADATCSNYNNLILVSQNMIDACNERSGQ